MSSDWKEPEDQQNQWHTLSDDLMNLGGGPKMSRSHRRGEPGQPDPHREQDFSRGQDVSREQGFSRDQGFSREQNFSRDQGFSREQTVSREQGYSGNSGTVRMTKRQEKHFPIPDDKYPPVRRTPGAAIAAVVSCCVILLIGAGLAAFFTLHLWTEATCTTARVCRICGKEEGSPLGHRWAGGDCTSAQTCQVCGEAGPSAAGHMWTPATCTQPKTCTVCGKTQGGTAAHSLTTRVYNDYSHSKIETEEVCTQCGKVINASTQPLTTLLDKQQSRFLLSASAFHQRLLYGAPGFDTLGGLTYKTETADTSQLGEKARGFTPPAIINVYDGSALCATFYFMNARNEFITEWDGAQENPFSSVILAMDYDQASGAYSQLPMLLIAACDPTMEAGSADTMLLAVTAFTGEGGVEHNGIFYSRVGGYFQATCVGSLT